MNKTLVKLTYLKYYYQQKVLNNSEWPNLNKHDLQLNIALQDTIDEWVKTLSREEYKYLKDFEATKFNDFTRAKDKKLITDIYKHFIAVTYVGGGWYAFKPNKDYNISYQANAHGLTDLHNKLKSYQLWSKINGNIVGID